MAPSPTFLPGRQTDTPQPFKPGLQFMPLAQAQTHGDGRAGAVARSAHRAILRHLPSEDKVCLPQELPPQHREGSQVTLVRGLSSHCGDSEGRTETGTVTPASLDTVLHRLHATQRGQWESARQRQGLSSGENETQVSISSGLSAAYKALG